MARYKTRITISESDLQALFKYGGIALSNVGSLQVGSTITVNGEYRVRVTQSEPYHIKLLN